MLLQCFLTRYWLKHSLGWGEGLWLPVHIACPFCPLILCHTLTHFHSSDTLKTKRPTTDPHLAVLHGWEVTAQSLAPGRCSLHQLDSQGSRGSESYLLVHRRQHCQRPYPHVNAWPSVSAKDYKCLCTIEGGCLVWEGLAPRLWIPLYSEALVCELVLTNILATGGTGGQGRWPRIIMLNVGGFFFLEQSKKPIVNH